ncbi:MAG: antibiotic biosynthesis monooxygenase [Solirubrobacteraceae bacterium]|nr:antibiotic biosynthesis monooxygenase [Solirubrobacteraceae bacterium]
MFASIRTYRIEPDAADTFMHRVDRDFAEALAQEPGFISYQCLDLGNGRIASMTIFEQADQSERSNELAHQWITEEMGDVEINRMGVMGGEVAVSRAKAELLEPAHH